MIALLLLLEALTASASSSYEVGIAKIDITGPPAEVVMMGYAEGKQVTTGIEQRLWARAFVIKEGAQRLAYVNMDIWGPSNNLHKSVVDRLQAKFSDGRYTIHNVVLHAIHTHQGPGGYNGYALYDMTTRGFIRSNFERIVNGVVKAIVEADGKLAPAHIHVLQQEVGLPDYRINRAPEAYNANKDAKKYKNLNRLMTLLHFTDAQGKSIGALNWYAVHPTSYGKHNVHISGDNKGYAEQLMEKRLGIVAAFAQSDSGDVSPNYLEKDGLLVGFNFGRDTSAMRVSGADQFHKAKTLLETGKPVEVGEGLAASKRFVDFRNIQLPDGKHTCPAAIGQSMLAGTKDGIGLPLIKQGDLEKSWVVKLLHLVIPTPTEEQIKCHGKKIIVFNSALFDPPLTPQILPIQVVRIGVFAFAALPFEVTTMAGRRLRKTLLDTMKPLGVKFVELSCIANSYAGYMTTKEEYDLQYYEGASTHFGPYQLQATQLEVKKVAEHLVQQPKEPSDIGVNLEVPPLDKMFTFQTGVIFDSTPLGKDFGEVETQPEDVAIGTIAKAVFWGSHPKNHFEEVTSFCNVERKTNNKWERVRTDDDAWTRYTWKRSGISASLHTCSWEVERKLELVGSYRFRAHGIHKLVTGNFKSWSGVSNEFKVRKGKH